MINQYIFEHGTDKDIDELGQLYDDVNDYLTEGVNYPGWKKGIYPVRETAVKGLNNHTLFILRSGGRIAGTVILSHEPESGYAKAEWNYKGGYSDILVIYTLVIHPAYLGQGIGNILMEQIIDHATGEGIRSLRLDVYEKNAPAIHLYEKYGFHYIDKVDLGYKQYGLDWFLLYEKLLND